MSHIYSIFMRGMCQIFYVSFSFLFQFSCFHIEWVSLSFCFSLLPAYSSIPIVLLLQIICLSPNRAEQWPLKRQPVILGKVEVDEEEVLCVYFYWYSKGLWWSHGYFTGFNSRSVLLAWHIHIFLPLTFHCYELMQVAIHAGRPLTRSLLSPRTPLLYLYLIGRTYRHIDELIINSW